MIARAALLAPLCGALLALGACGRQPGAPANDNAAADNAATSADAADPKLSGEAWQKVFVAPAAALPLFGRLGLRPGAWIEAEGKWRSVGQDAPLTDPSGSNVVTARFTATGSRDRVEAIAFALTEPTRSNSPQARDAFEEAMRNRLWQLGVTGADTAIQAIHGEKPMRGHLKGGTDYLVVLDTNPEARRTTVTFSRAAAMAGQTTQGSK